MGIFSEKKESLILIELKKLQYKNIKIIQKMEKHIIMALSNVYMEAKQLEDLFQILQ